MLLALYIILLIVGAKATWELVLKFAHTSFDDGVVFIILFVAVFLVIGPVMGIVSAVKLLLSNKNGAKGDS